MAVGNQGYPDPGYLCCLDLPDHDTSVSVLLCLELYQPGSGNPVSFLCFLWRPCGKFSTLDTLFHPGWLRADRMDPKALQSACHVRHGIDTTLPALHDCGMGSGNV